MRPFVAISQMKPEKLVQDAALLRAVTGGGWWHPARGVGLIGVTSVTMCIGYD